MKYQPTFAEDRRKKISEMFCDFAELREDEYLFLPCSNRVYDFPQALEFAAVGFCPGAAAKPLARMIANLFESHEKREHEALTPYTIRFQIVRLQLYREFFHRLLVKRCLRA